MHDIFRKFSRKTAAVVGSPTSFIFAVLVGLSDDELKKLQNEFHVLHQNIAEHRQKREF